MKIDPSTQSKQDNYKLLIGSIVPRPIAFVTSISKEGVVNAAPFSYFNIVGIEPPLIMISCLRKPDREMKDTARNAISKGEFIVHIVDEENVEEVNRSSVEAPSEVSELEFVQLTTVPGELVQVPRIVESKIAMECTLYQHLPIGGKQDQPNADLIIGEIKLFHIQDEIYDEGRIKIELLKPVSRLAGLNYGTIGQVFERRRPSYEEVKDVK